MRISSAESLVMEALWQKNPLSAEDVVAEVAAAQGWSEATVKTLLNRLLKKKAIAADKDGRRYLYRPLVGRDAYVESESQGLLDRLFDGRLAPLVSHFSQAGKLSPQDLAELKRLIEEIDDERR
ncbi:MAG TPA: BlaI/MecI/CopY family transcriptional regulator [Caulobacteraceae bacterium]|nr:BlaI/MecI/CopY family transcriptional regulator [Caulobacteraceae bacterium]